jgi:hypothetical protein
MSLIARSEAIPYVEGSDFAKKFDKFKIAQEAFDNIENPTDKQKDDYNKVALDYTKVLEKKELDREYEQSIVSNIEEFERIKADHRYEELMDSKKIKDFKRFVGAFLNQVNKYEIVVENGVIVKGKVGKMAKSSINIKTVKECWEKHTSGGKEQEFDRTYIDDTIKEIPTIIIQSNPELAATIDRMDHLLSRDDLDLKEIQSVYKIIKGYTKESISETKCKGKGCKASGGKFVDGYCTSCFKDRIEEMKEDIQVRHNNFKDNTRDKGLKARIDPFRQEHDEAYHVWEESNGKKGVSEYIKAYKALDELIPKQVLKNSKRIENKIVDSDDEEMGSESEYESDSSSSHSYENRKKREREENLLPQVLEIFQDVHPELKRLYKVDPCNFKKEFEETKKRFKKYRVFLIDPETGGELNAIPLHPCIFFSREEAENRGKEAIAALRGNYKYGVE